MLARMRLSQLCLGHREDRAVPDGIPDGLRSMWSDTAALADFVDNDPRPPVAPVAVVPAPGLPPAFPPPDLLSLDLQPPVAPAADAQPPAARAADAQPPAAQPPAAPALPGPDAQPPAAQPPAAPAADAALPAARVADAVLVAELEALRARCAELEARIEQLESSDEHAAADAFDFGARLAALETMMTQGWVLDDGAGLQ